MRASLASGGGRVVPGWLDRATQDLLEGTLLPDFFPRQRWFAGKTRRLSSVEIQEAVTPPGFPSSSGLLIVACQTADGGASRYFVPVVLEDPRRAEAIDPRWRIGGVGSRVILDGLIDPELCRALVRLMAHEPIPGARGELLGLPTSAYVSLVGSLDGCGAPRYRAVEQSHSAVVFGDRLFLKVFRRLSPGRNPDFELGRFLCERTRFDRVPTTGGALEYQQPGSAPETLALVQSWVAADGTAWECARRALEQSLEAVDGLEAPEPIATGLDDLIARALRGDTVPAPWASWLRGEWEASRILGARAAELHQALASDPVDPDFRPEPLEASDLHDVTAGVRDQIASSLTALSRNLEHLRADWLDDARRVLRARDALLGRVSDLTALPPSGRKIRIHGDAHLGQVLRRGHDCVFLDFEGEPSKSWEFRRAKQTPLRDVVGLLRSFDYAASNALIGGDRFRPEAEGRRGRWAAGWRDSCSLAFLDAYFRAIRGSGLLPSEPALLIRLVGALWLEKSVYELLYELEQRPDWLGIPLRAVLALLRGSEPSKPGCELPQESDRIAPGGGAEAGRTIA